MGRPRPDTVSPKLQRIAKLAGQTPRTVFTTLAHHIDVDFLREAYRRTRKDGAVGVDGQTAEEFEANLQENLESLLGRLKSGLYRAPPVRRVHIPKGDGSKTRPIGIPTLEDKVLQRAVTMVLEAVYEQDFWDCSYGFRPKRSAHQALQALWHGIMKMRGGWVLDADIEGFRGKPASYSWELIEMPTAPLVRLAVQVFDRPLNPFLFESFLNVGEDDQLAVLNQLAGQDKLFMAFYGGDLGYRYAKVISHDEQQWQQLDEIVIWAFDYWNDLPSDLRDFDGAKAEFISKYI